MSPMPSVSVCFPAFNEEQSVGAVLKEAHELLSSSQIEYEILLCDDGSSDRTGDIAEEFARTHPAVRMFRNEKNLGIRETFERLYSSARKDFVFINAVDRQWKTNILFEMIPLSKEYDIVIASRKKKPYGLSRLFISWVFNAIPSIIFGVRTFDAGAVKLIRREIIARFQIISRSPFSEAERLIRASRAGYKITAYPVDVEPRRIGRARGASLKNITAGAWDVARVWYALKIKNDW